MWDESHSFELNRWTSQNIWMPKRNRHWWITEFVLMFSQKLINYWIKYCGNRCYIRFQLTLTASTMMRESNVYISMFACVKKIKYEEVVGVLHSTMLNFPSSAFGSLCTWFSAFKGKKNVCAYSAHSLHMFEEWSNGKYLSNYLKVKRVTTTFTKSKCRFIWISVNSDKVLWNF